jgi:hypothetical protein
MDEPTVGLDPEERVRFRNLISDLAGERLVLLSTDIVSDVEATATSIALINHGRLLHHTLPEELLQAVEGKVWGWRAFPGSTSRPVRCRWDWRCWHGGNTCRLLPDSAHRACIGIASQRVEERCLAPAMKRNAVAVEWRTLMRAAVCLWFIQLP